MCVHDPHSDISNIYVYYIFKESKDLVEYILKFKKKYDFTNNLAPCVHLNPSNSNAWAAAAAQVCWTLTEADGSSLNKQWFEFELTLYNIHSAAT